MTISGEDFGKYSLFLTGETAAHVSRPETAGGSESQPNSGKFISARCCYRIIFEYSNM